MRGPGRTDAGLGGDPVKRSPGLQRHKPLLGSRDTHLAWQRRTRDAAIERALQAPRKATTPTKRNGKHAGESKARTLVYARSGGWCEIALPGCTRRAAEWHHRLNRSHGGRWEASNGLHLCSRCHLAVTNTDGNRQEYEASGWVISGRSGQPPITVPVQHAVHGLVLLDNSGDWTATDTHDQNPGAAA